MYFVEFCTFCKEPFWEFGAVADSEGGAQGSVSPDFGEFVELGAAGLEGVVKYFNKDMNYIIHFLWFSYKMWILSD